MEGLREKMAAMRGSLDSLRETRRLSSLSPLPPGG